ncbi:cytochrome c oxidase subunit II [Teichococcus vastitatis]|uniref:cytochrome-c oxidase n=1 Tax=Teichococcus vastitatis TaxID=2307076 RepID=A0ABS9VZ91_9PROT|nr:cytochrome c oxidase subunit II [Pseudoroseomonas vastitatis]MCI0752317.1 cytochrome c oxidase subunit II [Pseudoroseomonas vastitatis]
MTIVLGFSATRPLRGLGAAGLALILAGCSGRQSALDPAGHEARVVGDLFWWMLIASVVIWALVMAFSFYASHRRGEPWSSRAAARVILICGAILPTLLLAILLVLGLRLMPMLRAPGEELRIAVEGQQFWWRVTYELPDGTRVSSANEVRLPRGRRTEFVLTAQDVIHSFWVPPLAGKMDLIPGMTNRLVLEPERTGRFRGACAEFCGASHALMALDVEVMEPDAFEAWLQSRRTPPAPPRTEDGAALFLANGCGACHTVAGTEAAGRVGPDLTLLSERPSIAAGILPNNTDNLVSFIRNTRDIKPGARMPSFAMLSPEQAASIAHWLLTPRSGTAGTRRADATP